MNVDIKVLRDEPLVSTQRLREEMLRVAAEALEGVAARGRSCEQPAGGQGDDGDMVVVMMVMMMMMMMISDDDDDK